MTESTTALYRSIHTEPQAVRELLNDWHAPTQAAEKLAQAGRILLVGIGTSFHAAIVGEYLLHAGHFSGRALNLYGIGFQINGDVEPIFKQVQVFVAGAEQGLDAGAQFNIFSHLAVAMILRG